MDNQAGDNPKKHTGQEVIPGPHCIKSKLNSNYRTFTTFLKNVNPECVPKAHGIDDVPWTEPPRTVKTEHSENGSHQAESTQKRSNVTVRPLVSLSGTGSGELQFISDDWSDYADLSKLPRRSGVTSGLLRRLVLKELVDNALDECDRVNRPGKVTISKDEYDFNSYTVTDEGDGLNGTPKQIAAFFSLRRPKATSKLWPLPKRGAVGNGIRVIVGAVASGDGRIIIETRGRKITLWPQAHNGITAVEKVEASQRVIGTSIKIRINPHCPRDPNDMSWATLAISLAPHGEISSCRRANPHWIDCDHFCEMLRSVTPGTSVRDFTAQLDGCTSADSKKRITEAFGLRRLCIDLPKPEAAALLSLLQSIAKPVKPKYLGKLGKNYKAFHGYARSEGEFITGDRAPQATVPFVVECWATAIGRGTNNVGIQSLTINRSPAVGEVDAHRWYGRGLDVTLCGCGVEVDVPEGEFAFSVNLTSPRIPIVSEGKYPDLWSFRNVIGDAIQLALRRAARFLPEKHKPAKTNDDGAGGGDDGKDEEEQEEQPTQRAAILEVIPKAIEHCCFKDGEPFFEFNQRDLFYVVRKQVKKLIDVEPKYPYFTTVLTDYENEFGEIDLLTRDARGVFKEPHGGPVISMGTKTVASYKRPEWAYSNFLFVEKEKIVTLLEQVHFYERWDCFVMTSKGFCSRAGKDLLDKIAEKDEPTKFFCIHDADASGSLISQSLVQETRTRGARNVEVIDLGFFPWTALAEGLPKEPVEKKRKKNGETYVRPVADYVKERDSDNKENGNPEDDELLDGERSWEAWLQEWRVELNAITPPEFVDWINAEFEKHGASKAVPPEEMALEEVEAVVEEKVSESAEKDARNKRQEELNKLYAEIDKIKEELQKKVDKIEEEIDEEADRITDERLAAIDFPSGEEMIGKMKEWLEQHDHSHWRHSVGSLATDLIPEEQRPDETEQEAASSP